MVGIKPTHLWHHLCHKHFWWLVNERLYARCPPKKLGIQDPCQKIICHPHNQFNRYDFLTIVMISLAGTAGLSYTFGHIDYNKYASWIQPFECNIEKSEEQNKKKKKPVPCDEREPEPIEPCVCDEPGKAPVKSKKKSKKSDCA